MNIKITIKGLSIYSPLLTILILIVFSLTACNSSTKNDVTPKQTPKKESATPINSEVVHVNFTKDTFPNIDGSTATIPLSEAICAELLNMTPDKAKGFTKHNTTHEAYVNLINNKADIILVTEPSDEELALAKKANIELEVIPVVKDAFVFLVNTKNPVESLTIQQIQDIYTGKIKNWKEVGGKDVEITAFQRTKNSGSQTLMENLIMKNLKMIDSPKHRIPTMGALIKNVAGYDNSESAIGYSVYYYTNTMYNLSSVKLVSINNIKPEKKTIIDKTYPFASAYYAVIKKSSSPNSKERQLLKWLLSDAGQSLSEKAGYIPLR